MKHKLIICSFLSAFLTLLLVCFLILFYLPSHSLRIVLLQYFIPGLSLAVLVSIVFSLLYWQKIEKFFRDEFSDIITLERVDILDTWEKIVKYYKAKLSILESTSQFTLSLMDQLNEGILIFNNKRSVVFTNRSVESMLSHSVLVKKKHTWEVFQNFELNNQIDQVIKTNSTRSGEIFFSLHENKTFFYRIVPLKTFILSEDEAEYLLILQDLTKLRRLEKVRTEFVSNVSHELKSPLAAIIGFTETVATEELPPELQRKYLGIIDRNAQKMSNIINDLLVLSRIEKSDQLEKDSFFLLDSIQDALEMCKTEAEKKKISFTIQSTPDNRVITGNKSLITQVFRNLLENSIRYSDENKNVNIRVSVNNGKTSVSIQDEGYGIPKRDQERIFERFYQVDKSRTGHSSSGSGLGLAIVKHILQLHNGTIRLQSMPGKGTIFYIDLP